jgi:hypothetical protein
VESVDEVDNNGLDVIDHDFGNEGPAGLGGHEDEEAAFGSDDPDEAINKSLPPSPRGDAAAPAAGLQVQEAGADSNREASAAPSAHHEVDLPVRPLRRGPCPGQGPPPAQKKYPHDQIFCGDRDTAVSLAFVGVHPSIVHMARVGVGYRVCRWR